MRNREANIYRLDRAEERYIDDLYDYIEEKEADYQRLLNLCTGVIVAVFALGIVTFVFDMCHRLA